jgi:chemosensory pili system protein ChpC
MSTETLPNELYSLLIPLGQERLIVPRAAVAEVIGWQVPQPMEGVPQWYLGTIPWSGRPVPVVSFDVALGHRAPEPGGRTRIVILIGLSGELVSGYFGVVTQGFPQLVRVSPEVIRADTSRTFPERSPVACQVRMLNEYPLIPDFDRLEKMIAEETRAA